MAAFQSAFIMKSVIHILKCVCVCLDVNLVLDFGSFLLQQELVKYTYDAAEKSNLKIALDAMKVSAALPVNGQSLWFQLVTNSRWI